MRTYILELKADYETEEQFDVIKTAMKRCAREVLATSMLLGGRPPQVALHSKDFFHGNEDLEIDDPAEE